MTQPTCAARSTKPGMETSQSLSINAIGRPLRGSTRHESPADSKEWQRGASNLAGLRYAGYRLDRPGFDCFFLNGLRLDRAGFSLTSVVRTLPKISRSNSARHLARYLTAFSRYRQGLAWSGS